MRVLVPSAICFALLATISAAAGASGAVAPEFPLPLDQYGDGDWANIFGILRHRISVDPFNLVATVIFVLAIVHTFCASKFMKIAHRWRDEHAAGIKEGMGAMEKRNTVSMKAEIMHFFGEVEAIFGIWVAPLLIAMSLAKGWSATEAYVNNSVTYKEPMFVVVIMCIAGTRPVLAFAESCMRRIAALGNGTPGAWWLSILSVGPLLGSFITEPAAMTICAMMLARQFFDLKPSNRFRYATLGLLFVNISVGGTLTHFAAPPVIMVAGKWGWDTAFMFLHFGWKSVIGIVLAVAAYFLIFRKELELLKAKRDAEGFPCGIRDRDVPAWVTTVHLAFVAWTVFTAHYPALFIGGFLFFLAFTTATGEHQDPLDLRPALLVGFFLAGLVVHAGLQGWWIEPALQRLSEIPLFLGAMGLTAFNDNAAITSLATLAPGFSEPLKHAVVAGAIVGGGLTVIANAPNPAGQAILGRYFPDGVSPARLLVAAVLPTAIVAIIFFVWP